MPSRTGEFLEACRERQDASGSRSDPSTSAIVVARRGRRKRQRAALAQIGQQKDPSTSTPANESEDAELDIWSIEAARISHSLTSLQLFLTSIRRAYLDLNSSSHGSSNKKGKGGARDLDLSKGILEAWRDVRWLNDMERDEVDYQAKVVLRRCIERVKQLETAEKNRHNASLASMSTLSSSRLTSFLGLPALAPTGREAAEETLHAHRQQVTLYLSRRLAVIGTVQKEQQEERVARQLERGSLGDVYASTAKLGGKATGKGGDGDEDEVPDIFVPAPISSSSKPRQGASSSAYPNDSATNGYYDDDPSSSEPIESLLSASQIQQFESESSALLQSTNAQLASIQRAESSLLEIAALQEQLASHLMQQVEMTDKLWEDSVLVSGRVQDGNVQLKKARERNREGRVWLLVFLVGASLSLLFLEYY